MLTDPMQALIESKKLKRSAEECRSIIEEINVIIEELPSFWEGVSANMFIQNNRQVSERLKKNEDEMHQISDEIETLASSAI